MIKTIFKLTVTVLLVFNFALSTVRAQAPQSFKYQAVVRDASGIVIANQMVGFQLSILQTSETGTSVYSETFTTTTNSYGLVNLMLGEGAIISGDFSTINWGVDSYFLKVELDETGGTSYVHIGTSKLNSVPYALNATKSDNTEKIQGYEVSINSPASGQVLKWNGTEWAPADDDVTGGSGVDGVVNSASFSGTTDKTLTLGRSNGLTPITANFTDDVDDADADPNNEIQTINKVGSTVTLSNGGGSFTDEVDDADNDDTNELITGALLNGTNLEITDNGGTNTVNLSSLDNSGTDSQTLLVSGTSLTITGGNTVVLQDNIDDADHDIYNELQVLNFSNDTLYLSDGGQVYMGAYGNLWEAHGDDIYNTNTKNVGVGLENPLGKLVVQGDSAVSDTLPLFEVKNKDGQTVFAVYDGGVRVYVNDDPAKANNDKSGFAIGGYRLDKTITNEYLRVTPDSVRVYIKEENTNKDNNKKGGFAIGGYRLDKTVPEEYLNVYAADTAYVIDTTAQMLWYPLKEAFLAGKILVEHADSVGQNSWATGYISKSIGDYSQALGYKARAFGDNSTAIGYEANADGLGSIAFGSGVQALGNSSIAIGYEAVASGLGSMAIGCPGLTYSNGVYHLVDAPKAINNNSYAFGMGCIASGKSSFAFGVQTESSFHNATSFGYKTKSSGYTATAMGYETTAKGYYSTSTGLNTIARSINEFVVGRYNDTTLSNSTYTWVDSEPLFIIGNGDDVTRHNAMMVLKNGNVGINTNSPEAPLDIETNSSGYALHIEENGAGSEEWQLGVNVDGDLNFFDGNSVRAVLKDGGYLGLGITNPGYHRLYVASGNAGVSNSSAYITNSSGSGISLIADNSSTSSSDLTMLVTTKGTGDIVRFDSYHGNGTWDDEFRFDNDGDGYCDNAWHGGGADYAEYFPKADTNIAYEPGDIIMMSPTKTYTVDGANNENTKLLVGVYSNNPAMVGNSPAEDLSHDNDILVGLMGVINTKVNTENGVIKIGDYITISSTPKVGMKATNNGMVIGRAMDSFDGDDVGMINVLVEVDWYYNTEDGDITSSEIKANFKKQQDDINTLKAEIEQLKQILEVKAQK